MMELTEEQEQGIKMLSKILTKQYPFIIDASPNITDFEQYDTLITIKIIVSKLKLEDYFMKRVHYDWNEFWRFSNIIYPNPDPEDLISKEFEYYSNINQHRKHHFLYLKPRNLVFLNHH